MMIVDVMRNMESASKQRANQKRINQSSNL
jgi:hypothetical protein